VFVSRNEVKLAVRKGLVKVMTRFMKVEKFDAATAF